MNYWSCDFETTTVKNDCRVWAWAIQGVGNELYFCGTELDDFFAKVFDLGRGIYYFHNLKFDGEFILNWLFRHGYEWTDRKKLASGEFSTLITDRAVFYEIKVKGFTSQVTFRDSLKIIPLAVSDMSKAFGLDEEKLEIDYIADREKGHVLTEEEKAYIRNDVDIVAKSLVYMFEHDLTKMTIGSNALYEYKNIIGKKNFSNLFPVPSYDEDVRKCYKGGFSYVAKRFKGLDLKDGVVLDVNSLYPSVMYYKPMPYGEPIRFEGKYEDDKIYNLYVQVLSCHFKLKDNYIPTIQLKNNLSFVPTEYLESSDNGTGDPVILYLTSVDLSIFFEHYEVWDINYYYGWKFKSSTELFKPYVEKWNDVKMEATRSGNKALRQIAKLLLNNLYGKFALNPKCQQKRPYLGEDGVIHYSLLQEEERSPIYVPVGAFITAWARYTTITAAQKLYDRFVYADTDSLHLIGSELPDCIEIDDVKLGAWKHESSFTRARYLAQKTYIEEIDGKLNIVCAGMPKQCYPYVTWDNFYYDTIYPEKLRPVHVPGGIVLEKTTHTIRKKKA